MARSVLLAGAWCLGLAPQRVWGQLRVMSPKDLVDQFAATKGMIEGSTATFGAPFYGERLMGQVVWDRGSARHCAPDDYDVKIPKQGPGEHEDKQLIHIIMVRRGDCSFVRKVHVAEEKGAHAVIIVDKEDSDLTPRDIRRIIVADDGYGQNVAIPSVLISKEEGEHLIKTLEAGNKVIVELAWDVPTSPVVVMDLWMSSASRESNRFLHEFSPKRKILNEAVKFVPHYAVFGLESGNDYNDLCTTRDGTYCAEDPDGSGPVTGVSVLHEDVRQLCIHELTKVSRTAADGTIDADSKKREYAEKFWDYVEKMFMQCPLEPGDNVGKENGFGATCSEALMRQVGIDVDKVNHCMDTTMDAKLKNQRENVAWSPRALRINGWRYSGVMDADVVSRAICSAFVTAPPACSQLQPPPHSKVTLIERNTGVTFGTFFKLMLIVAVLSCGALLLYKRSLKRNITSEIREEVMLEVQAQMDTYKQLSGGGR